MALIAVTRSWDLMFRVTAEPLFTPKLGSSSKKSGWLYAYLPLFRTI